MAAPGGARRDRGRRLLFGASCRPNDAGCLGSRRPCRRCSSRRRQPRVRRTLSEPYALAETPPQPWRPFRSRRARRSTTATPPRLEPPGRRRSRRAPRARPVDYQMGLAARSAGDARGRPRGLRARPRREPSAPGAAKELAVMALAEGRNAEARHVPDAVPSRGRARSGHALDARRRRVEPGRHTRRGAHHPRGAVAPARRLEARGARGPDLREGRQCRRGDRGPARARGGRPSRPERRCGATPPMSRSRRTPPGSRFSARSRRLPNRLQELLDVPRVGPVGVELQRLLEVGPRFRILLLLEPREPAVVVGRPRPA